MQTIEFIGDTIVIDGKPLRFGYPFPPDTAPGEVVIMKTRPMIEKYIALLREVEPRSLVELGIQLGGSVALTSAIARPEVHVALELKLGRRVQLDAFIDSIGMTEHTTMCYGIDQGDREAVLGAVNAACREFPLDIVIDDASHRYHPSAVSFDALFPMLRPGGRYLIEDWASEHGFSRMMLAGLGPEPGREARLDQLVDLLRSGLKTEDADRLSAEFRADPSAATVIRLSRERSRLVGQIPLSRLGLDLAIALAETDGVFERISFDLDWIEVVRGDAVLDPATFRLADLIIDTFGVLPHPNDEQA